MSSTERRSPSPIARSSRRPRSIPPERLPEEMGRYEIIECIGEGAIGAVYSARDTQLERTVAIKVLKTRSPDPEQQARIQREAHAMAQLSHPNVAQVYEVGEVDGQTFIAMEYVAGATLWSWQQIERSWHEILEMYVQVGDGLVAAHEAGIVHRDFKPQNVLVSVDGRPRVIDFGLARQDELLQPLGAETEPVEAPAESLTRVGALLGTPAYMAPEQLAGEPAGPASDQFSFCVALFEALYRRAPFDRRSLLARRRAIIGGCIQSPDDRRGVPGWLYRSIRRGLCAAPAERWPTLAELLDECRRDRRRDGAIGWRRRASLMVAFALVVLAPAILLLAYWGGAPTWPQAIVIDAAVLVGVHTTALFGRRWLPPSEYNELFIQVVRALAVIPIGAHLLGWLIGLTPEQCAPFVLGMFAVLGLGAWRPGMPVPLVQTAIMSVGALATALSQAHAWWFTAGAVGATLAASVLWILYFDRERSRRRARPRAAR